jgi:hypothetical protein
MVKYFYLIFLLLILSFNFGFAQEESTQMNEQMKVWMDYMTPGPMHKMMARNVGEWKTETKFWNYPDAEPMMSEGKAITEAILGGRYFKTTITGDVMGMPMEGWSIEGYDNGKKEFVNFWIDNMGSGMARSSGMYDDVTKIINYKGTMYDPMAGKDMEFTSTAKQIDDNKIVFEMYSMVDGKEFKMMEMTYTR